MNKILIQEMYLKFGLIIPKSHLSDKSYHSSELNKIYSYYFNFDIEKEFANISKEDARKIKRKFRKLARKAKKQKHNFLNASRTRKGWQKYAETGLKPPPKNIRNFIVDQRIKDYDKLHGFGVDIKNPVYIFKKKIAVHNFIIAKTLEQKT